MTTVLVANPSADLYGSDRMLLEAVRGMTARGWRVVMTCSEDGPLAERVRTVGAEVRVLRVPVVRKAMLTPRGLVSTSRLAVRSIGGMRGVIRTTRPDVLLVNTVTIPLWVALARLMRLPVAVHVHEAEQSLSRPARLGLTMPLSLANLVVYNSEVSRTVSGLGVLERHGLVKVVHNGVRAPAEPIPPREQLVGPLRVVYAGRLSPRKGVDLVLSAARGLLDRGFDVMVDLVGAVFPGYEWYEEELRELVRTLDLDGRVRFHGFQDSVWAYLADADVVVVPSRLDESFGNAVIEALLAARPVVVSDHTGLREAADGFGAVVLTARDSLTDLVDGLQKVHDEWPELRRRAVTDADSARHRYSPERYHAELNGALALLVDERSSGGLVTRPTPS